METLAEIISVRGTEALGRYYSMYRAKVISNEDPQNLGRICVIPVSISNRPIWVSEKGNAGSTGTGFKWLTPRPGDIVWVEYEDGDRLYPVWSHHTWASGEMPKMLNDVNTLGFVTREGHSFTLNDTTGEFNINIIDTTSEEINNILELSYNPNDGLVANVIKGKTSIKSKDDVSITTEGKIHASNSNLSLKDLLEKLIDGIKNIYVQTGTGPSSYPVNNPEFDSIKQDLNNLLN